MQRSILPVNPDYPDGFRKRRNSEFVRIMMELSAPEKVESQIPKANPGPPFEPCHMFFYGSLMDPDILQTIAGLQEPPEIRRACINGFTVKMWGIYPALIPTGNGTVLGTTWEVTSEEQFRKLAAYETSAYTWCECEIELEDGNVLLGCRTFCWAGHPESRELEDGSFDLDRYQKHFKASVIRFRSKVE